MRFSTTASPTTRRPGIRIENDHSPIKYRSTCASIGTHLTCKSPLSSRTEIHTDATNLFTATKQWDDHYVKDMYAIGPADE